MRGIGFEVEEMMKLFLVIIIGLGIVILIIAASGGISSLLAEFCAKNPAICGGDTTSKNDATVDKSVDALICAINSVSAGNKLSCSTQFQSMKLSGVTGFAIENAAQTGPSIECNFKKETIPEIKPLDPWYTRAYYRIKNLFSSPQKEEYGCTVYNFNLPQKVTTAEKWIAGYGDPQYIVYWQNFPQGEERAWSSYSTWLDNVGTVVLFALPADKILEGGGWLIKKGATTVAEKVGTKLTAIGSEFLEKVTSTFKMAKDKTITAVFGKEATSEVKREALKGYYSKYILDQYGNPAFIESAAFEALAPEKKLLVFKDLKLVGAEMPGTTWSDIETIMKVAKVTTPPALMAALVDSMNEKYNKKPGNIVIKTPYLSPTQKPLENKKYLTTDPRNPDKSVDVGYVVILDKQLSILSDPSKILDEKYTQFYLASPCHADLKIKETEVFCQTYTFDPTTSSAECAFTTKNKACEESVRSITGTPSCKSDLDYLKYVPQCGAENTASYDFDSDFVSGTSPFWCKAYAIQVSVDKSKYNEDRNFCFTRPKTYTGFIFVGAILTDLTLKYFGVGFIPQVTAGILAGATYVAAEQYERWP